MALFELLAKIKLQGADEARRGLDNVSKSAHETAGALSSRLGGAIKELGVHFADTAKKATFMSVALGGVVGVGAFQAAAKMDSLTRGLASVSANAQDLEGQLNRLREVAKLPGLGFEEAVQGSVALQAAGISARLSERSLMAFGNALASVGKGKADLDGVTLALQQIASKGKISAEEINQLNERVPQIRKAMQAAFGTSDTEALGKMGIDTTTFINGVVTQLERLPRVTGGIQNSIENMSDAIKTALVPLGKGIADMFMGASNNTESLVTRLGNLGRMIGEVFSAIGNSGVLGEVFSSLEKRFTGIFSGNGLQQSIARFAGVALSILKNIPDTIADIGSYLSSLFGSIWQNITRISSWAVSALTQIFGGGSGAGGSSSGGAMKGGFMDEIGNKIGDGIMKFGENYILRMLGLKSADAVNKDLFGGGLADVLSGKSKLPGFPGLVGLPSLKDARISNPLQDADRFTAQIMGAFKPYSQIPEGLNFGGGTGSQGGGVGNVFAAWDKHLADIEKNTKATADALEPRKVFGGGELAKMGVTAAEKATRPDMYTRSVNSTFQEAVRRAQRAEAQRTGRRGTPLFAR